jgi:dTDP-4-amino-4,6-dideoxygalactose transaminase
MAALLLNIQPGDEIIVPSYTFVSTINAFVLHGATPVFVDIREDTLNLDERILPNVITSKTKAIVPVHYAGVGCEMDSIMNLANDAGVKVIEDNAHGLFAKYKGKHLGTFGVMATQSFHETKNIVCGEGGALLINEPDYIERAEILREKGTNRSQFFRGEVDKYTWVDKGSSYLPSDILAAFLLAQLEKKNEIQTKRKTLWERYHKELKEWAETNNIKQPSIPEDCEQSFHLYYILLPSEDVRTALIKHLKAKGITAVFHYLPLHTSLMGRRFGGKSGDCPVTEDISPRLLRLPFYTTLNDKDQSSIISVLQTF